jgi:hypothetical protein
LELLATAVRGRLKYSAKPAPVTATGNLASLYILGGYEICLFVVLCKLGEGYSLVVEDFRAAIIQVTYQVFD